jgi:outer membrane protein TolC
MLNGLNADQELFAAELGLAQARRDKLLSLVQLYKGVRRWVAVKSSTDTRNRWPKPQPC